MSEAMRQKWEPVARAAAQQYGLDPDMFARQMATENINWDEDVITGRRVSSAGAQGIAQFMPATAQEMGIDPLNPEQALYGAARYMGNLTAMFDGNAAMALAGYNAGGGRVQQEIRNHGDNWAQGIPDETKTYLERIMSGGNNFSPRKPPRSTEDVLADLNRQLTAIAGSGEPLTTQQMIEHVDGDYLADVPTDAGKRFEELIRAREALEAGLMAGEEALSPNTLANVAQADRVLAESRRQFDEGLAFDREGLDFDRTGAAEDTRQFDILAAQDRQRDEEAQRQNNLAATLDLLEAEVRRGELSATEATQRLTAATEAANLQRGVLQDWGGRALPAGTEQFPGLEGSSAAGDIARSMGLPFPGFDTLGTFGINPSALAGTIPASLGPSSVTGLDAALANAAGALAGLGVPGVQLPQTPGGRAQRPPSNGVTNAATALAGMR